MCEGKSYLDLLYTLKLANKTGFGNSIIFIELSNPTYSNMIAYFRSN